MTKSEQEIDKILKDLWTVYYNKGLADDYYIAQLEAKTALLALISTITEEAKRDGAKDYNRVLTDNLGQCEYTAVDAGVVAIYRQEVVGSAIRKANDKTIMTTTSLGLQPKKEVK